MKNKYDVSQVLNELEKDRKFAVVRGVNGGVTVKPHNKMSKRQCAMVSFLKNYHGALIQTSSKLADNAR